MKKNILPLFISLSLVYISNVSNAQTAEISPVVDEHAGHMMSEQDAQPKKGKRFPKFREKIKQLDQDGNKRLDRSEVEGHQRLEKNFGRMDRNNNGYIGLGNRRKGFKNKAN